MIRGFHLVTRGRPLSMATSNNSQSAGPVETAIREKVTTPPAFRNLFLRS